MTSPHPRSTAYRVTVLLHEMRPVTIAALRGGSCRRRIRLGVRVRSAVRVGDETVVMNTAFLDVGVAGDMGVPWTLPRIVGAGRARDLSLFPAQSARRPRRCAMGLLSRVMGGRTDSKRMRSHNLAARLSKAAIPRAHLPGAHLKANYLEAERVDLRSFISIEAERHVRLLGSEDRIEAFRAWLEKRPGNFKGR